MGKWKKKLAKKRKQSQSSPPQESAGSSSSNSGVAVGGGGEGEANNVVPLKKNPFHIPVIVRQIMGHLNKVNDLKGFRLMSRVCLDESLGKWRDTAVFRLNHPRAEMALKHTLGLEDNFAHSKKSRVPPVTLYRLEEKPFKNYKLKPGLSYPPTTYSATTPRTLHFFWENCGPSVKYLDLSDCYFKYGLHLEGLKWVLGSCPNIEELKLALYKTVRLMDYLKRAEYMPVCEDSLDYKLVDEVIMFWVSLNVEKKEDKKFQQLLIGSETIGADKCRTAPEGFRTAGKLKSLSIDYSEFYRDRRYETVELFKDSGSLCVDFLGLMPNLTTFSIRHMDHPDDICAALGLQIQTSMNTSNTKPIHLEKFMQSRTHKSNKISLKGLSDYLAIAERPKLKILQLDGIQFNDERFWNNPSQLMNVLKGVREDVEELNLSFDCKRTPIRGYSERYYWGEFDFESHMHFNTSFDLFNVNFSKLTKLKLVFDYCKANVLSFSLNFALFRGTPNLKHCHVGTRGLFRDLDDPLAYENDVLVKKRESGWYLDHRGVMRSNYHVQPPQEEEEEPILLENDIVLDKMKIFHYEGALTAEHLKLLGQWMKNLEVLKTILDDDTFPIPFQVWGRASGGKLRKLTNLMFKKGQVRKKLITKERKLHPEVEILKRVQRERRAGWTKQEKECPCGNDFDQRDDDEYFSEDENSSEDE